MISKEKGKQTTAIISEEKKLMSAKKEPSDNTIKSMDKESCCFRTKVRTEKEHKDLMNRLSRIEGQIRGIRRMVEEDAYCIMVEEDAYCIDIINQVAAANAALNSFTKVILADHIHTCVTEDVQAGGSEKVDELVKTLQKLMK